MNSIKVYYRDGKLKEITLNELSEYVVIDAFTITNGKLSTHLNCIKGITRIVIWDLDCNRKTDVIY